MKKLKINIMQNVFLIIYYQNSLVLKIMIEIVMRLERER